MTDEARRKLNGRNLLLSAVLAALPLAGCETLGYPPEQQQMYSQVVATKSPALASDFIRKYPDSPLVRNVLLSLPPAALKRLAPDAVAAISPDILKTLPADLLATLGLSKSPPAPVVKAPKMGYEG